jgi:DNA-directed RNA polymerase subunit RPC12/RpoP
MADRATDLPPALRPAPGLPPRSTPPPRQPAPTAPPTSPPVFVECWNCHYSFDGLATRHGVTCPECGLVLRRRLAKAKCVCGRELPEPDRRGVARCTGCARETAARVPDAPWPLRCASCRCDLTGQEIRGGLVRCPACEATTRWRRGPGAGLTARETTVTLLKPMLVFGAALAFFAAVLIIAGSWGGSP